jgi:hypothetical protein
MPVQITAMQWIHLRDASANSQIMSQEDFLEIASDLKGLDVKTLIPEKVFTWHRGYICAFYYGNLTTIQQKFFPDKAKLAEAGTQVHLDLQHLYLKHKGRS